MVPGFAGGGAGVRGGGAVSLTRLPLLRAPLACNGAAYLRTHGAKPRGIRAGQQGYANSMTSNEAARTRAGGLIGKVKRALGPAGVFLEGFIREPRMVGSVIPSSMNTIDRMLAPVDWEACDVFVEYGPGVGTFCRPILDRLRRDAKLIAIDTNPLFIDYLKRTIPDSRFSPVLGSAADVEAIVKAHGADHADYVVSGLPFSTLPDGVGPAIAAATHRVIRPGGAFLVYQFSARARDFMEPHFARIDDGYAPWNIPPCKLFWGWKA